MFNYLLISLGIQIVLGTIAIVRKTDILTDISYGLTFLLLISLAFWSEIFDPVKMVLYILVALWALRIAGYLFIRILKTKRDKRFDGIRENPVKFMSFWLLQGVTVWVVLLPSIVLIDLDYSLSFNAISIIGIIFAFVGLIIEGIADMQKFRFKSLKENEGRWVDVGLWRFSRHPNYLGEIMVWVGAFIFVLPFINGISIFSIISPLFIYYLLTHVSGIPTLEKKYDERFKDNKEYQEYKKRTGRLLFKF
ncbi:MAG TPA: DUF1295 domain-containing protein [Candidatus Dojkabacteria bacterium]|nr:DUF1295 domain-containing protein [Candidatus Dojkabacteria bacterium]